LFIVCDFDGTITERDTLDLLVHHFAPTVWDSVESRLRAGDVTLLQAMEEEFRAVRASESEVVDFILRESGIRKGFPEFVQWVERQGYELVVVSAGFRTLIDPVLEQAGLHHLHVHAGDALFTREGAFLSFPPASAACIAECGHCKSETIAAHGPFSGPVVYVGDGYSDRCSAQEADVVFAREGLAEYLDQLGLPYYPFETFFDVLAVLEQVGGTGSAPRATGGTGGSA
jgi:2-hydroxy-3-keto-5-methylthiopentenyl-1-phosphate phosphatase